MKFESKKLHGKGGKRVGAILLVLLLLLSLAACGQPEPPQEDEPLAPKAGEAYEDGGTVLCLSSSIEITPEAVAERTGVLPSRMLFASTTSVAVNYLLKGDADLLLTLQPAAQFYAARSEELTALNCAETMPVSMLVSYDYPELVGTLNGVLKAMKEDGTFDALYEQWVTAFAEEGRPEQSEAPAEFVPIEAERVIRVGFSGTMPLIDYVYPDGAPGGFTAALFNELQKRTGFAIAPVHVLPESKISALLNDKIDVYLWHCLDVPEVVYATDAYLTLPIAFLKPKPVSADGEKTATR